MKLVYQKQLIANPLEILRKAGYSHFVDPNTKEESFIFRLTAGYYPRFHLYLKQSESRISFDLHLDQKKSSYKGSAAHSGEYDGPTVTREMERIRGWIFSLTRAQPTEPSQNAPEPPQTAQVSETDDQPARTAEKKADSESDANLFGGIF